MNIKESTRMRERRAPRQAGDPPDGSRLTDRQSERPAQGAPERILQRLDWQVIRRLDGLLQGDYRSLFYGYGVDFADLREYQAEDDIRYIDWNVTARMDTPYVRQYVEDREINAWFLVDLSPSMDFGTAGQEKRRVLVDVVATLARLLTRHGNRVGAVLYSGQDSTGSGRVRTDLRSPAERRAERQDSRARPEVQSERIIPARGGRNQVLWLINDLLRQPRLASAGFTDLKALLDGGLNTIKKRSLVFVVSDFISAPEWERSLSLLNQRHEVLAIRVWDPSEVELPDMGPVWLEDSETGEQLYVDTHDSRFREQFTAAARQRVEALASTFRHAGVESWALATDEDLVRAILRYAAARKQIHRGKGGGRSGPGRTAQPAGETGHRQPASRESRVVKE